MPDARVQSAIDHWAPRFVQAGMDYSDFVAHRGGRALGGLARGLCRNGDMHAVLAEEAAGGLRLTAGEAWLHGAVAYHFAKFVWVVDAERAAPPPTRRWPRMQEPTSTRPAPSASRRRSTAAGSSATCAGPRETNGRRWSCSSPGSTPPRRSSSGSRTSSWSAGWPRCRSTAPARARAATTLPIRPDYDVAVTAVLDALAGRADLDLDRVGALGVSLGGYYAPRAAAFEPRIRAGVGISGPFNFGDLGPVPGPDARDVRAQVVREGRGGARARRSSSTSTACSSGSSAGAVRHRQARPPDPVGAHGARPTRRRTASSSCSRTATTGARTCRTRRARWSRTGSRAARMTGIAIVGTGMGRRASRPRRSARGCGSLPASAGTRGGAASSPSASAAIRRRASRRRLSIPTWRACCS